MIGTVYRPVERNANGDPVDESGNIVRPTDPGNLVGEINGIVMGGQSIAPSRGRQESSDTTGQIGRPTYRTGYAPVRRPNRHRWSPLQGDQPTGVELPNTR